MPKFKFDVKCFATVEIEADSEEAARALLEDGSWDGEFGTARQSGPHDDGTAWVDCNLSPDDSSEADLVEVDGEAV